MLKSYVEAFETLDPDEVVHCCRLPCMLIAPGNQIVVDSSALAREVVGHLMEQARNQGYHRTEIRDVSARRRASDLA